MVDACLELLDLAYFEAQFALEGLADEHVWKRPAEGLLSIGELVGHVAYAEVVRLAGDGLDGERDLTRCHVTSPLVDLRFRYYPATIETEPTAEQRAMTSAQVWEEWLRVHQAVVAHVRALSPDPQAAVPGYPPDHTYGEFLKYLVFHVSYHVGQMYSARHLLGEQPPDN